MIQATNGQIGVEPFKTTEVQTINVGGFAKVGQKHSLTALKVVFGNKTYPTGCTVYVAGECCKAPWAVKVFKLNEKEFILMPEGSIWLIEYQSSIPARPPPTSIPGPGKPRHGI